MEGAQIASPLTTASIQYVINVVLTLPAIIYLDRVGRRPAMIIGSFFLMTWLFISGTPQLPSCRLLAQPALCHELTTTPSLQARSSSTTASPTTRTWASPRTSPGWC